MNFSQVVQAVIDITKRPDKQSETERTVNAALSFFIIKGEFTNDLDEFSFAISTTEYNGQVDMSLLTNFRRFSFVQPSGFNKYLSQISPESLFSPGGNVQTNVYYVTGTNLNYVLSSLCTDGVLNVGYYKYPPSLSGTGTHWFLDAASPCVIDKAASRIFQIIGDDSSMSIHNGMALEYYDAFVRDHNQV